MRIRTACACVGEPLGLTRQYVQATPDVPPGLTRRLAKPAVEKAKGDSAGSVGDLAEDALEAQGAALEGVHQRGVEL
jgi:hypothetical protein